MLGAPVVNVARVELWWYGAERTPPLSVLTRDDVDVYRLVLSSSGISVTVGRGPAELLLLALFVTAFAFVLAVACITLLALTCLLGLRLVGGLQTAHR